MLLYRQKPIKRSHNPAKISGHRKFGSRGVMFFVCHMTLQDHMIKALYEFMVRNPPKYFTILTSLIAIVTVILEI